MKNSGFFADAQCAKLSALIIHAYGTCVEPAEARQKGGNSADVNYSEILIYYY
jgi:hypothetical protein